MINSKESDALQWLKYYSALERVSGLALCVWCTFSSFMSPSSCTMSSLLLSWRDDILCSSSSFLCLKHTQTQAQSLDLSYMQWFMRECKCKNTIGHMLIHSASTNFNKYKMIQKCISSDKISSVAKETFLIFIKFNLM